MYCHAQTDCFVSSKLFSAARHVERFKLGSTSSARYKIRTIFNFSKTGLNSDIYFFKAS